MTVTIVIHIVLFVHWSQSAIVFLDQINWIQNYSHQQWPPYNYWTIFHSFHLAGSKRQRISTETDHETGSESSPSSPRMKNTSFCLPISSSPNQNGRPSSPESDLDVDSAPDEATPENLSLKKDDSTSPPHTPIENVNMMRHVTGNGNGQSGGFMPYHQTAHFMGTMPSQRSPIDVLLR